jgi:NAD(P)-dependent dehydrogenase (short-subunit alcohol dehydrogenase family)
MKRVDGQQRAQAVVDTIVKSGGKAFAMKVDVSDRAQDEKMFQAAIDRFG